MRAPRWLRTRRQPVVAALVALSLLGSSLGIPVIIEPAKDISRPYPCMHHRCGCASAEACWQGCCCLTRDQKLAWAKQHGITPPDDLPQKVLVQKAKASCGSCCQADPKTPAVQVASEKTGWSVGLVLSAEFRHCQGLSSLWLTLGHALPPQVETGAARFRLAPGSWLRVASHSAESLALAPATPPPRAF